MVKNGENDGFAPRNWHIQTDPGQATNSCEVGDLHQLRGKAVVPVKEVWEDETTGAGAPGAPGEGKSGGERGNGL